MARSVLQGRTADGLCRCRGVGIVTLHRLASPQQPQSWCGAPRPRLPKGARRAGLGQRPSLTACPAASQDGSDWRGGIVDVTFRTMANTDELDLEKQWLASTVAQWLDEEWTPLAVHRDLGLAAAEAYASARASGQDEAGSVLLALIPQLQEFDYRETFVDAFEVSNKVVEMVMLREGRDVCCTSDADKQRVQLTLDDGQA